MTMYIDFFYPYSVKLLDYVMDLESVYCTVPSEPSYIGSHLF